MLAQPTDVTPTLFKTAATIAFISAVHHIHRGFAELYPAWKSLLPSKPQRAARTGWDYMNVSYAITILLNLKWARNQGPRGIEEEGMLTAMVLGGVVEGWRSLRNGEYLPLVAFWGIPGLSLAGTILKQ